MRPGRRRRLGLRRRLLCLLERLRLLGELLLVLLELLLLLLRLLLVLLDPALLQLGEVLALGKRLARLFLEVLDHGRRGELPGGDRRQAALLRARRRAG